MFNRINLGAIVFCMFAAVLAQEEISEKHFKQLEKMVGKAFTIHICGTKESSHHSVATVKIVQRTASSVALAPPVKTEVKVHFEFNLKQAEMDFDSDVYLGKKGSSFVVNNWIFNSMAFGLAGCHRDQYPNDKVENNKAILALAGTPS